MRTQSAEIRPQQPPLLSTPVQFLKGVGPHRAELLKKINIHSVSDLLSYYPRDHQDRRILPIREASPGKKGAFKGEVVFSEIRQIGKNLGQARAVLKDRSGRLNAVWFKRISYQYDVFSSLRRHLAIGQQLMCYGTIDNGRDTIELKVEDYDLYIEGEPEESIVPIYPLTQGVPERWLRKTIQAIVQQNAAYLSDPLPEALRTRHQLLSLAEATRLFHAPLNWADRDRARERLAFDEFFFLELALAMNRQARETKQKGFWCHPKKHLLSPFKRKLGYEFTRAQTKVINEIFKDMALAMPMNRLLQGDVGSGKTVVALSAALLAIENNRQVVFLAPTEILAEQHMLSIDKFFNGLPMNTALLTRSTSPKDKKRIIRDLANGDIHLLIGTHAILNENIAFKQMGLIIIDEQHRFGVRQRAHLIEKNNPDVLIMTATPIPRTLALTLYGDLNVSLLDELPPGRAAITSHLVFETEALRRIEQEIAAGHQAYVVFPLIEESATKTFRAATVEFEKIKTRFPSHQTALLHGRMKGEEKKRIMDRFRKGEIHILVATPVIEVGIDVPNATVIAIMSPERFGLAQLHQLRGRVGRGTATSQCLLVCDQPDIMTNERLVVFCATSDGFRLAEEDLKIRGPGELIGEAQHGIPLFRVGNLLKDSLLIAMARQAAHALVKSEIPLTMKEFSLLNQTLNNRFGKNLQLSNVG